MARLIPGVLGGFVGSLGPIVGFVRNGKYYIRAKPIRRKPGDSPALQKQKIRFKLVSGFLATMKDLVALTFTERNRQMSSMNYAMSYNLSRAVKGNFPGQELDYPNIAISKGKLPNVSEAHASGLGDGTIKFRWKMNDCREDSSPDDKCILVVYCPSLNKTIFTIGQATRKSKGVNFKAREFENRSVHTWLSFMSHDGKTVANSIYTGSISFWYFQDNCRAGKAPINF